MLLGSRCVSAYSRRVSFIRTLCSDTPANPHSPLPLNEIIKPQDGDGQQQKKAFSSLGQALEGIRSSVVDPSLQRGPSFLKWIQTLEGAIGDYHTVGGGSVKAEISGIRDLETLGLGDSFAVRNLKNNLIWRCRNMSMEDLLFVLTFTRSKIRNVGSPSSEMVDDSSSSSRTDVETKLYKESVKCLERRWTELSKPEHLITMIICSNSFSKTSNEKVEDRVSDLAGGFLPPDVLNIIIAYAKARRRPLNVLKNLAYHLRKNMEGIEPRLAIDGLFALSAVSLFDKTLIQNLADVVIKDESDSLDQQHLSHCLVSLGRIRHYDERLMNKISECLAEKDMKSLDDKTLHSYAMTSALLNYRPKDNKSHYKLCKHILTHYSSSENCVENILEAKRDVFWLEIVWSLSLLGFTKHSLFESVLDENFLHKIIYASSGSNIGGLLKILNVNAISQYLEPDYKGPKLDFETFPLLKDVNSSLPSDSFNALCLDIFSNFACPPNHANVNANTGMGFSIGAEAVINKKNFKPMDVEKFGCFGKELKRSKIPEDCTRLAMLSLSYFDCNLNGSMGGMMDLRARLLKSRGFKVLFLHHSEIMSILKKTDKVKHVEKLFKKVIS